MTRSVRSGRAVAVVAAALAVLLTSGCAREFGPGEGGPGRAPQAEDTSAQSARDKLELQRQDPCDDGDARAVWPRCARWAEEIAGTARTAAGARPDDRAVTAAAGTVTAGRDAFLARGCGPVPAPQADPGACIAALLGTREGVRGLAAALGTPGG